MRAVRDEIQPDAPPVLYLGVEQAFGSLLTHDGCARPGETTARTAQPASVGPSQTADRTIAFALHIAHVQTDNALSQDSTGYEPRGLA